MNFLDIGIFQKLHFYQAKMKDWCLRHPCLTQCCPAWKEHYCFRGGACGKFWSWQHPNLCLWKSIWVLPWSKVSHPLFLLQGQGMQGCQTMGRAHGMHLAGFEQGLTMDIPASTAGLWAQWGFNTLSQELKCWRPEISLCSRCSYLLLQFFFCPHTDPD